MGRTYCDSTLEIEMILARGTGEELGAVSMLSAVSLSRKRVGKSLCQEDPSL